MWFSDKASVSEESRRSRVIQDFNVASPNVGFRIPIASRASLETER